MTLDQGITLGTEFALLAVVIVLLATIRRMARESQQHIERMAVLMRASNVGESVAAVERLRALDGAPPAPRARASDQPVAPGKPHVFTRIWRRSPPKTPSAGG